MKFIRIIGRSISSAFKSVVRNFSLSIASISCIIITLILVAFAILLSSNVNNFTKDIENDLTIVLFAKEGATNDEIKELKSNLDAIPNIKDIVHIDKDQMKEDMKNENETYAKIISEWDENENPLQDCFEITVENIDEMGETATTIKNLKNVDVVRYGEEMVDDMVSVFDVVQKATIVAVIALIFVTAFLISNTIKITIYSRKNEIDIMRLVGTSNAVIKLPFIFEGLFLGLIGSIIPVLFTIYGYVLLYDKMGGVLMIDIISLIKPADCIFKVSGALVLIGALVGMYGSWKSVRKYLKI